jgi:pteridine reductase
LTSLVGKTALITGGARRIGASIARILHGAGMNLALHYFSSSDEAENLQRELNAQRAKSVILLQGDLRQITTLNGLVEQVIAQWNRLDVLVNNASSFYPTPVGAATEDQWHDLVDTNLKAPFFLAQAAAPQLRRVQGNIVNIIDVHAQRPMAKHPIYCSAKAGLAMLTQSLARDLAPDVRVNGVAPGAILWPESGMSDTTKNYILSRVPLKRPGDADDIARALLFLVRDGGYITGQVIAVDGGRTLSI